jgi:hypothetical protein
MLKQILEELVTRVYIGVSKNISPHIVRKDIAQAVKKIEGIVPKEKEVIDVTKKMCHNLEYPTPCLYDEPDPNGATCLMQDRKISKEQCKDYRDMQVEYEDFAERNQLFTELIGEVR